jgi:cytochrome c-type biogenesis protein CcmH
MTLFIALALALAAIVLLVVLLPLLRRTAPAKDNSADRVNINIYRDQLRELDEDLAAGTIDQTRHAEARAELERRLLEDTTTVSENPVTATAPRSSKLTAVILAVLIPIGATGLYFAVGTPAGLAPEQARAGGHDLTPQQVEELVAKLAARMKESPENGEGWVMLGRSYAALERYVEAAEAYAQAVARIPNDAQLLVDYADVLAMSRGRKLAGEPEKLVQRALAIDPNNGKALALAGTAAFDRQDYATAVNYWQRLAASLPPDSEIAGAVQNSIAEAQTLAGTSGTKPGMAKKEPAGKSAAAPAQVSGSVALSAALKARAAPDDTVFIFARAAEGSPAPLAVLRKRVADLPAKFVLDDSMAMAAGMNLSKFGTVIVGARISKSGKPARQSGDLEGLSKPVKVGSAGVSIVIDQEIQ